MLKLHLKKMLTHHTHIYNYNNIRNIKTKKTIPKFIIIKNEAFNRFSAHNHGVAKHIRKGI